MKTIIEILFQFVLGFFSTLGFVAFFNGPIVSMFPAGFNGACGWTVSYVVTTYLGNKIFATFLGSFVGGLLGELCAIKLKKPATVFIIPAIIPMVPGAGTYYTMLYLIQKDFYKAATYGVETMFIAAAIAIGIIFSTVLVNYIRSFNKRPYAK